MINKKSPYLYLSKLQKSYKKNKINLKKNFESQIFSKNKLRKYLFKFLFFFKNK